jgi:putative Ca2+/H+ antiporter (TMEM165/GDT1 family)
VVSNKTHSENYGNGCRSKYAADISNAVMGCSASLEIMNWHLLGLSFITVFLSEIGDKSQLAAIALSGRSQSPRAVFLGAAGALLLTSLLGALAGGWASALLPVRIVKAIAAMGFALLAVRLLWPEGKLSKTPTQQGATSDKLEDF